MMTSWSHYKACPFWAKAAGVVATVALVSACGVNGSASGGGGENSAEQLEQADEAVARATAAPTSLPITEPLDTKPGAGKTVVEMVCDAEVCGIYSEAFEAAAEAVGWTVKQIPFKNADPATLNDGLDEALRLDPAAVFLPGAAPEQYASKQAAFVEAKIPLITSASTQLDDPSGLFIDVASTPWLEQHADIMANWAASETEGEGNVMVVSIPELRIFQVMGERFKKTLGSVCPGCRVTETDVTYAQFASGQGQDLVVSALRRDPSVNVVFSTSGTLLAGLPAKLKAAGIGDNVKFGTTLGRQLNMADIISGDLTATTNSPLKIIAWEMFDAAIRLSEGMKVDPAPYNESSTLQLMTKENVGAPVETRELPEDYESYFKSVWKVG